MPFTRRVATGLLAGLPLTAAKAQPALAPLEVVLRRDVRPGNPAVSADGRLFFSQHPFDNPNFKLLERRADGTAVAYPDQAGSRDGFGAVIGLKASVDGMLWVLDIGGGGVGAKLVAFNLASNTLAQEIRFADNVVRPNSFFQDFALDQKRGFAYIADATFGRPANPAMVVVNLRTGAARRVMQDNPSFLPDPGVIIEAEGQPIRSRQLDGTTVPVRFGLDPITIDVEYDWVYFGAGNGRDVFRIPAAALADPSLGDPALASRIERYRDKVPCDGISIDRRGNIYVTDVGSNAIGVSTARGYRLLAQDPRLVWPDGLCFGPDGWLYVTTNQLNRSGELNEGREQGRPPYYILRTRPLAPSEVGR